MLMQISDFKTRVIDLIIFNNFIYLNSFLFNKIKKNMHIKATELN